MSILNIPHLVVSEFIRRDTISISVKFDLHPEKKEKKLRFNNPAFGPNFGQ